MLDVMQLDIIAPRQMMLICSKNSSLLLQHAYLQHGLLHDALFATCLVARRPAATCPRRALTSTHVRAAVMQCCYYKHSS